MARIRYQVASSLDGFIAGPDGEFDWLVMDPAIDFEALFDQFDTLVMGRATYEVVLGMGEGFHGKRVLVFSRTLDPAEHPEVTVVGDDFERHLQPLRAGTGKDTWLFGGGELFRFLLERGYVDTVELAVMPILLGEGIRFLPPTPYRTPLSLARTHVYPSGIVMLEYSIGQPPASVTDAVE